MQGWPGFVKKLKKGAAAAAGGAAMGAAGGYTKNVGTGVGGAIRRLLKKK